MATALEKDFVKKFADEFMRLYTVNGDIWLDWQNTNGDKIITPLRKIKYLYNAV